MVDIPRVPPKGNLTLSQTAPGVLANRHARTPPSGSLTLKRTTPLVRIKPQYPVPVVSTGDVRFLQQLSFPSYAVNLDWLLSDQNLLVDGYDLQSAVIVALGTDMLAPPDEPLPGFDDTDRRGWWGDLDAEELWGGWPVGCLLWLLQRAKITGPMSRQGSTLGKAEGWTREAMAPFSERRITSRIDVLAEQIDTQRIDVGVVIYRGPEPEVELRYSELWDELGR